MTHATAWMNLKIITLSERSQKKGTCAVWFLLYKILEKQSNLQ